MSGSSNYPQPRFNTRMCDAERSAVTIALYHGDIIAAHHYTDTVPHYLVKPGKGGDFRRTLYLHGLACGECYHQDGDPSGLSDWRKVEKVEQ